MSVTASINKRRFYRGERIVITGVVSPATTTREVRVSRDYYCKAVDEWFYIADVYPICYSDGKVCRFTLEMSATIMKEDYCEVGPGEVQRWRSWIAAVPDGASWPVYTYVEWEVVNSGPPPRFTVVGYDYSRRVDPGATAWLVVRVRNDGGDGDIRVGVYEGSLNGRQVGVAEKRVPAGATAEVRVEFPAPGTPGRYTYAAYAVDASSGETVWYVERFEIEVGPGVSIKSVSLEAEPLRGERRARVSLTIELDGEAPVDLTGEYLLYANGEAIHHGFFEVPKGSRSARVEETVDLPGYGSYALYAEAWLGTKGERVRSNTVEVKAPGRIGVAALRLSADRDEVRVSQPVVLTVELTLSAPAPRDLEVPVDLVEEGYGTVTRLAVRIKAGSSRGSAAVKVAFSEPGTYTLYAEAPDEVTVQSL